MGGARWLPCLVAIVLAGCGEGEAPSIVVAARDLGPLEQSAAIRGRDGGYSGLFQGRSVWIYGDTILGVEDEDGSSWRNNSVSHTADLDAADGITGFIEPLSGAGVPLALFPQTEAEQAFNQAHSGPDCQDPCGARWALWPGPIVEDPARDRALIIYSKIYGEPGEWNFHGVGMGIAVWPGLDQPVERPVVRPGSEHPTLLFAEGERIFESAAVVMGDLLYLFGCGGDDKECRLARVPLDSVHDRATWRFFAGDGAWSPDVDDAVGLFRAMDMSTVHWNRHLGAWLAVYSPPFENRVMIRTSPALTGPWSLPMEAFQTMAPGDDPDHFAYSGLGHGEYARDGGRFEYISYYRGTAPWAGEIRLVEIELP